MSFTTRNADGDVKSLSVDGSIDSCKSTAIVSTSFNALMLALIYASLWGHTRI